MADHVSSEQVEKRAMETSGGGPVLKAISRRLRAYNKKIKHAEETEAVRAAGKAINEQQASVSNPLLTVHRQWQALVQHRPSQLPDLLPPYLSSFRLVHGVLGTLYRRRYGQGP